MYINKNGMDPNFKTKTLIYILAVEWEFAEISPNFDKKYK
jgi:hypothetical protein